MNRGQRWASVWASGFVLLLAACTSTLVKRTERAPNFDVARVKKVLVLAAAQMPERRQAIEKEFALQWRKRKVEAVASSDSVPDFRALNRTTLRNFAQQNRMQAVLVVTLVKSGAVAPTQEAVRRVQGTEETPEFGAIVAVPQNEVDYRMAVVRAVLYDADTEKPVWSAESETVVFDGDVQEAIQPYVKTILKSLYQ